MAVLALFDLDHTLLAGDSDQLWGDFLRDKAWVGADYQQRKDQFYLDYLTGSLNYHDFIQFVLAPLKDRDMNALITMRHEFAERCIGPRLRRDGIAAVRAHRQAGDEVALITATNRFIAQAAADQLGIEHVMATQLVVAQQRFTGEMLGTPCFREGKIDHLKQFLVANHFTDPLLWFYSDSHNDLPLLSTVDKPVVVCPDDRLHRVAVERQWPVLSWQ